MLRTLIKRQNTSSLYKPAQSHTFISQNMFQCDRCPYSTKTKGNLKKHCNAVHMKMKPFQCKQCPKAFAQKGQLATHDKMIHRRQKDFECKHCRKKFATKQNRQTHINNNHKMDISFLINDDDDVIYISRDSKHRSSKHYLNFCQFQ